MLYIFVCLVNVVIESKLIHGPSSTYISNLAHRKSYLIIDRANSQEKKSGEVGVGSNKAHHHSSIL